MEGEQQAHGSGTNGDSAWGDIRLALAPGGVLQGSILGPALLAVFIKNLGTGLNGTLCKFANDTKLGRVVNSLEGRGPAERPGQTGVLDNHQPCEV